MRKYCASALVALAMGAFFTPSSATAQGGQPFLSQQMLVGFTFCPRGWSQTHNQILPINSWQSLYSLLGTTYGGDGRTTFALPALRSRVNIGVGTSTTGTSFTWGARSGQETVTLLTSNMAGHNHAPQFKASSVDVNFAAPQGGPLGSNPSPVFYGANTGTVVPMAPNMVVPSSIGSSTPFDIRMPYETIITCIAMEGIFPSRN